MLDELARSDIFFLITGITVIVVGFAVLVVLWILIRILFEVRKFVTRVRREGSEIIDDVSMLRSFVKRNGSFAGVLLRRFVNTKEASRKKKRKPRN